jgi:hypothetical protein
MTTAVLAAVAGAQSGQERHQPLPPPFRQPIILIKCSGNLKVHAVRCGTLRQDFAYEIGEEIPEWEGEEWSGSPGLIRRVTSGLNNEKATARG